MHIQVELFFILLLKANDKISYILFSGNVL